MRLVAAPEGNGRGTSKESKGVTLVDRTYGACSMVAGAPPDRDGGRGAAVASAGWVYPYVGKELVPDDDQSEFEVFLQTPEGSSLERTDRILRDVESALKPLRGVEVLFTTVGTGERGTVADASVYVGLTPLREGTELERILQHLGIRKLLGLEPLRERDFTQNDVMREARRVMARFPS